MNEPNPSHNTTDDRFLSFQFLSYELENISDNAGNGSAAEMRQGLEKLRKWRADFEKEFAALEAALDFGALDALLGDEK